MRFTVLFVSALLFVNLGCSMNAEPEPLKVPSNLQGLIIDSPATKLPDFKFVDHNNKHFDKTRFENKWSLVFFGYTNCPDVCPTSLSIMDKVSKQSKLPENMQYVFVSVDPKRDTPEKLKGFVEYFNPKFVGATGAKVEIDKFQEPLGVIYDFEGDTNSDDYIVNHFAAIYIIDPKSRERAYILPPHSLKQVGEAFNLVYDYYK
ncbi:MAG: SCO family protein [Gammaproteobacteria bacterium]|nr:SCO family protein [Gammaproteobacteria bacterium]